MIYKKGKKTSDDPISITMSSSQLLWQSEYVTKLINEFNSTSGSTSNFNEFKLSDIEKESTNLVRQIKNFKEQAKEVLWTDKFIFFNNDNTPIEVPVELRFFSFDDSITPGIEIHSLETEIILDLSSFNLKDHPDTIQKQIFANNISVGTLSWDEVKSPSFIFSTIEDYSKDEVIRYLSLFEIQLHKNKQKQLSI